MGAVAMNEGLKVPDMAVRVGGAVPLCVRLQEVIVQRTAAQNMVSFRRDPKGFQ